MDVTCTTSDHLSYVCSLGSGLVDFLGVSLQVAAFTAGAVVTIGVAIALYLVLRTMTERDI